MEKTTTLQNECRRKYELKLKRETPNNNSQSELRFAKKQKQPLKTN